MSDHAVVKAYLLAGFLALFMLFSGRSAIVEGAPVGPVTPHRQWQEAMLADLSHYQPPPYLAPATDGGAHSGAPQAPALFDDDHRLVYQSYERQEWNIYYDDLSAADPLILAHTEDSEVHPRLNRGATRIVFASNRDGDYELFLVSPDGTNVVQLTDNGEDDVNPFWSPDGTEIVFESYRDGQPEIYVMNADGSDQRRLTQHPSFDGLPAWSQDGSSIAFTSHRDGLNQIYVMDANGGNLRRLTTSMESYYPAWSPDNLTIAFSADGDGDGWLELWTMDWAGNGAQRRVHGVAETDYWVNGWVGNAPQQSVIGTAVEFTFSDGEWFWNQADPFEWILDGSLQWFGDGSGVVWHPDVASVDDEAPVMPAFSVPEYSRQEINVQWLQAPDSGGTGTYGYESHVQEHPGAAWQVLHRQNPATGVQEVLPAGKTYRLRVRALDGAYNYSDWFYPDATTVYTWMIESRIYDNRGNVLANATVETNPPSFAFFERNPDYFNYVGEDISPIAVNWSLDGYGSLPETAFDLSDGDAAAAVVLPPANDLLSDGNFESGALAGWHVSDPQSVILEDEERHTGDYSVYFSANTSEGTTLSQTISVSLSMNNPTLSFFYVLDAEVGIAPELEVRVTDDVSTQTVLTLGDAQDDWQHAWTDLSAWVGETITVSFYRPAGLRVAALDDISLGSTSPDLWLANSGALAALPGETVTRTLQFGNRGGVAAPDTTVTLTLPAELTLVSASPMPSEDNPYIWDLGEVAAGDSGEITLVLTMDGGALPGQVVTAQATIATGYEAYLLNNETDLAFLVGTRMLLPLIMR